MFQDPNAEKRAVLKITLHW